MTSRDIIANEKNFLGCLLRSPDDFWRVNDGLGPEMFTISHHRELYSAIRDLSESGRRVTFTALQAHLPEEYEDAGPTIGILAALKENAMEAGSASDYVELIAQKAGGRQLHSIAKWLAKEANNTDRLPDDVAAELALRAQEIMAMASPIKPKKLSDITERVVSFSTMARDKDVLPGFTTGLSGLDELVGLLMGGDFIGVLGALAEGKSAVIAQVAKHIGHQVPVLFAHNEMSEDQNGARAVASEANMSVREIREGAYDFQGAQLVKEAQSRLLGSKVYLYTDPKMTVRGIKSRALQMKRTIGLGAIAIDGMKRLRIEGKFYDAWERKEAITGALKELAIELNVPLLAACQRTRKGRRNEDPTPHLDDADYPTLETDADIVLGVWREESHLMMNKPPQKAGAEAIDAWEGKLRKARGIGKMIGLKVRSGTPFEQREFRWNGPQVRFEDL